jgi:2-oxoglutarate dehydrogenase E2 component (dihydrolipoamide succinyltransferase)
MTIEIKVPVLPESVADALLLDWNKQVGDSVKRDEIIVEVETDKVVLEVPAPVDGILTEIVEQAGATVLAEQVLARIEPGAAAPASEAPAESDTSGESAVPPAANGDAEQGSNVDHDLSPAVRRLVAEAGLDTSGIKGTGRDGRLTKEDVIKHVEGSVSSRESSESGVTAGAAAATPEKAQEKVSVQTESASQVQERSSGREQTTEPMSRLRQTIASRLVQAQQSAALLTTFNEVNMQPVMELRSRYKEAFEKKHGARLGFMSFFVKASVIALQRFPLVNAHIDGTDIVRHNYNDIGIAVSSPRGLVVPVLRNCESMSYADVEQTIQQFGARAKAGKLGMDELTGGTFTITNGGVFGSLLSTPIVNPPQSAILGMHKIQERPMAENGEVVVRPMMYLALSYDHRIIDGKEAVQFLVTVKEMLEDPARLLLDC